MRQRELSGIPLVDLAMPYVGHYVTRNRGTVGGSIAHADASAELPLCLLVLGGTVHTSAGRRAAGGGVLRLALHDGPRARRAARRDVLAGRRRVGFSEFALRHGDFALAACACSLELHDGTITEARVGVGAVVDHPTLLELDLVGAPASAETAREAGARASTLVDPFGTPARIGRVPALADRRGRRARARTGLRTSGRVITVRVNGVERSAEVEPRLLLSDFLRHDLGLTARTSGCEHGVCGACTVELDGVAVRSCLMLAIQVDGSELRTVEGLPAGPLQEAFHQHHALQCGFCTPGILIAATDLLAQGQPTRAEIVDMLSGHLCRCTGYTPIVDAIEEVAAR